MNANMTVSTPVRSPCVGLCRIEPTSGWCEGCLRSLDEIAAWSQMPAPAQREVLVRVRERRRQRALAPLPEGGQP